MSSRTPSSHLDPDELQPSGLSPVWRLLSILIVAVAAASMVWGLAKGAQVAQRQTADRAAVGSGGATASVQIVGFGDPAGLTVTVLGMSDPVAHPADQFAAVDNVLVPASGSSVMALERADGSLAGLAWAPADPETDSGTEQTISPLTTAETLVVLAPGVLDRDPAVTQERLELITESEEFTQLIAEVTATTDLRSENPRLERALAATLDQLTDQTDTPGPGCGADLPVGSTLAAGTCLRALRGSTTIEATNGHQRWTVVYPAREQTVCALVPPRPATATFVAGADPRCPWQVDVAAPGELADGAGPVLERQVALAALLTAFSEYAVPAADLTLGAAGLSSPAQVAQIADDPEFVESAFGSLLDDPAVVATSLVYADPARPAGERSLALLTLGQVALADRRISARLIARTTGFTPNNAGFALLELHQRAGRVRTDGANPESWRVDAWERVDLEALIDRAGS